MDAGSLVYAALLSPKGKLLHDLFLFPHNKGLQDAVLMDVDAASATSMVSWLNRYKLRRPISIQDVSSQHTVWVSFGQRPTPASTPSGWYPDPRTPELGYRTVLPADEQPSTSGDRAKTASERDYRHWRYRHGVAEGAPEMPADKVFPLDYSMDALNGMSYTKGCYVGQERSSFTHFRGVVRKRVMPIRIAPATDLPNGADVVGPSGTKLGHVVGAVGDVGLAHLKVKEGLACMHSGGASVTVQGQAVQIMPFLPSWWNPEWGHEEDVAGGSDGGKAAAASAAATALSAVASGGWR